MRKMTLFQAFGFIAVLALWGTLAGALSAPFFRASFFQGPWFRAAVVFGSWFSAGVALHRLLSRLFPLPVGEIPVNSRAEYYYFALTLPFHFFLYFPLVFSGLVPVPLSRLLLRLFGARIGDNTYPAHSTIFDPRFVTLGRSVILGHHASIVPHVSEGRRLAHHPVRIGDRVTIGVNAVIFAGTTIGDGAVVAAGAVVPKFSRIGENAIWAGIPARPIGRTDEERTSGPSFATASIAASARLVAGLLIGFAVFAAPARAALQPTAAEVARMIYDRDTGRTMYSENDLVLIDQTGLVQSRVMIQASQKRNGLMKNFMRFSEPSAIAGTTFLSFEVAEKDDEQFLYLPELGRDRRIVSSQRDGSFMGTDFSFEDMERRHFLKDEHRLLGEAVVLGASCWILESTTRDGEESQYGRRVTWVGKQSHLPLKGELYSRKGGRLLRRFEAKKIAQVDGVWTLMDVEMAHVERNHRTQWRVKKVTYNRNLSDRLFTRAYMKLTR
jgi:carbonic anhydrase/acetyltransferase-like protein (isoleucine patch superfamily)